MALKSLKDLAAQVLRDTEDARTWSDPEGPLTLEASFVEPSLTDPRGEVVRPDEAIERARGIMIVGPPGAGKTTLLRVLARRQAASFLAGASSRAGLYVAASELNVSSARVGADLTTWVGAVLARRYQDTEVESLVRASSTNGSLSLFLDGLDEVLPLRQPDVFRAIHEARDRYPHLQLVCSSRPSAIAGWPQGFSFFHIDGFTDASVAAYLHRLSAANPARAQEFIQAVAARPQLAHLTRRVRSRFVQISVDKRSRLL